MKRLFPNVHLYKVNTLNSDDLKNKYADGGAKPYFKFFQRGNKIDEVPYLSPWSSNEQKVRDALARHHGAGAAGESAGNYDSNDGKVF